MPWNNPLHPVGFLLMHLRSRVDTRSDHGASAVEWVIITAVLVGIAVGLGVLLTQLVETKAEEIDLG
ncbi:hypothetical protein [Thalassiella azotivora]